LSLGFPPNAPHHLYREKSTLVPQQFTDDWEPEIAAGAGRGEGMPQIVQANGTQRGTMADGLPGTLQIAPGVLGAQSSNDSKPTRERVRGISGSSLIPGLGVKLSTIILAGPTILSAVGACPLHDGVTLVMPAGIHARSNLIIRSLIVGRGTGRSVR